MVLFFAATGFIHACLRQTVLIYSLAFIALRYNRENK